MNDGDLSIQGTLAETTVPDLIRSLIRSNETGIVSLEAIGRHDSIYVSEGKIVFATTSDPDLGLAEVLLRTGDINLQQYNHANEEVLGNKAVGTILCELGYLSPDELIRGVERQVCQIVNYALGARTGSYSIEFTSEFPRETISLPIQTERLVMNSVIAIGSWSLISRGIGRMSRLVMQSPNADSRIYHIDVSEEESHIYSLLSEAQTVESICGRSYLSNFATCRTIWALLSVNLLMDAETADVSEQKAVVENELEIESEVERYNSAYQTIFQMVQTQIGDHIYDFVDRVVLHLSEETLPYLSGINLLNEGRVDFDQLLNNLVASGSKDRRLIVHHVLNELLYGWIFETRVEFGDRLEKKMSEIVEPLRK